MPNNYKYTYIVICMYVCIYIDLDIYTLFSTYLNLNKCWFFAIHILWLEDYMPKEFKSEFVSAWNFTFIMI